MLFPDTVVPLVKSVVLFFAHTLRMIEPIGVAEVVVVTALPELALPVTREIRAI